MQTRERAHFARSVFPFIKKGGQPRGMLNFHWLRRPAASPYIAEVARILEACERCLRVAYFLKVQERSGQQGVGLEGAWGQRPS